MPYTQATANTQLVGAEIAMLVNTLNSQLKVDPKDIHLIGHSLGYYFFKGLCALKDAFGLYPSLALARLGDDLF